MTNITVHMATIKMISSYAGNQASSVRKSDGNYKSMVRFENADVEFVSECLECDSNVLEYSIVENDF